MLSQIKQQGFNTSAQAMAYFEIIENELFLINNSLDADFIQWLGLPLGYATNEQELIINLDEFDGNTVQI